MEKFPGLYVHIPFCVSKCSYCGFYSVTSLSAIPDFLRALFKEMAMVCRAWGPMDTVYIGGGSPSVLSRKDLEDLLRKIRKHFTLLPDTEITLEVNPGDLDISFLRFLHEIGINRLNMGIQSFDERILCFLGRRHSVREAISAIESSRQAGFDNIGLDLIYGIPGQGIGSWIETLSRGLTFSPEHLSCYELTLEPKTPLEARVRRGDVELPGEELKYEFFRRTSEVIEDSGYVHYEVSNFARGMPWASRHNQKYWDHTPYLGLGPGAHSFAKGQRWWDFRSLDRYETELRADRLPVEEKEILTLEELRLEALFLGLRKKAGIHLRDFATRYGWDLIAEKGALLNQFQREGLISIEDGFIRPTRAGLALADRLSLL
jgi:oxygen-independent coproporphyrinogen III oxidase